MSQFDFGVLDPKITSGRQLAILLGQLRDALNTGHSGAARPTYAVAGTEWIDTSGSEWLVKRYDGAADTVLGSINPTTHAFSPIISVTPTEVILSAASVVDLASTSAVNIAITGGTTIGSFGSGKNQLKIIRFTSIVQITNGSALVIPGGTITTAVGDIAIAISDASGNWRIALYQRASGLAVKAQTILTPQQILDSISATTGTILFRASSGWTALSPGDVGQALRMLDTGLPGWVGGGTGVTYTYDNSVTFDNTTGTPFDLIYAQTWGGGAGGGAASNFQGGGGGGGYDDGWFIRKALPASIDIAVGTGGVPGAKGGLTSFGDLLSGYGGGSSTGSVNYASGGGGGGGGGGNRGAGGTTSNNSAGAPGIGTDDRHTGGVGGASTTAAGNGFYGGGGGGSRVTSGGTSGPGGSSIYGGGGGGGKNQAGTGYPGGASQFGGNGGDAGVDGTVPGGGGGVNANGAQGRCKVTVFGG